MKKTCATMARYTLIVIFFICTIKPTGSIADEGNITPGKNQNQSNHILELCELQELPDGIDPESLRKLITVYLITDDNFLYYIVFGIRNKHKGTGSNSFILFQEIRPDLKYSEIFRSYDRVFAKKGDAYMMNDNVITQRKINGKTERNIGLDLSSKDTSVQLNAKIIHKSGDFLIGNNFSTQPPKLGSQDSEREFFSSYTVKCLDGQFQGSISINGNTKDIVGTAFVDTWCMNKDISMGNWDWGVTWAGNYVLMHFNGRADPETAPLNLYVIWENGKLRSIDLPPADFMKVEQKELRINYRTEHFGVEQKINYKNIPLSDVPTWLAPYTIRIRDKGEDKKLSGLALVEKRR